MVVRVCAVSPTCHSGKGAEAGFTRVGLDRAGVGDSLQMAQPEAAQQWPAPVAAVPCAIAAIAAAEFRRDCRGVCDWRALASAFGWQCPMMSLPHVLGKSLPGSARPLAVFLHAAAPVAGSKRRVGLCWQSGVHGSDNRESRKACHWPHWKDCSKVATSSSSAAERHPDVPLWMATEIQACRDLADTADLIQPRPGAVGGYLHGPMAHGRALDKPVWLMLKFDGGNFWLDGRSGTRIHPWIFRQPRPGDWAAVIDTLVELANSARLDQNKYKLPAPLGRRNNPSEHHVQRSIDPDYRRYPAPSAANSSETVLRDYKPRRLVAFSRDERKQSSSMRSEFNDPCTRYFRAMCVRCSAFRQAMRNVDHVARRAGSSETRRRQPNANPTECIRTNARCKRTTACHRLHGVEKAIKNHWPTSAASPGQSARRRDRQASRINCLRPPHTTTSAVTTSRALAVCARCGQRGGSARGSVVPSSASFRDCRAAQPNCPSITGCTHDAFSDLSLEQERRLPTWAADEDRRAAAATRKPCVHGCMDLERGWRRISRSQDYRHSAWAKAA